MNNLKIKFAPKVVEIIAKLEDNEDIVAFELYDIVDPKSKYDNILNIQYLGTSKAEDSFDVIISGKRQSIHISKFIKTYLPDRYKKYFDDYDINTFIKGFNRLNGQETIIEGTPIEHKPFTFNPKDVRSTFLSMVTKTYPYKTEKEVLKFLPSLDMDEFGNYYKIIPGDDTTMFTSHLDTADRVQSNTKLFSKIVEGEEYIYTDGNTILGADDKAGVTVMLYMMNHNIPGIYYFFIGEEVGGIGSRNLANVYDTIDYLSNVKKCISFDRRKTGSVITRQLGTDCCSTEFAEALCSEYNKNGLNLSTDPTGVYTDSASFIDDISECTNVSVGYNNEHTGKEIQNMTYLENLCKASLKVDWKSLPSVRKVGINSEVVRKYKILIDKVKKSIYEVEVKVVGHNNKVYIRLDLLDVDIKSIRDSLVLIQSMLRAYKLEPNVTFEDTYIKIELT